MGCDSVSVGETVCGAVARAARSREQEMAPLPSRDDRSPIGARSYDLR